MGHTRTVAIGGAALLLAALILSFWPLVEPEEPAQPRSQRRASSPKRPPAPPVASPVGIPPEWGEPRDSLGVEVAALEAVGSALGRRVVQCAPPPDPRSWVPVPWAVHSEDGTLWFLTARPAGAVEIAKPGSRAVLGIFRWSTAPDGAITCMHEAPDPRVVPVRVVERSGAPVAGAAVSSVGSLSALTDEDGRTELTLNSEAPVAIHAYSPSGTSGEVWVGSGDSPTVVLIHGGGPADDFVDEMQFDIVELHEERLAGIRAALATPGLAEEVVAVLEEWEAGEVAALEDL